MRKLLLATAAVAAAICLAGCSKKVVQQPIPETQDTLPVITYDTLTDTRDGQTYKTVKIGTQTWMARNLNYKTENGSWCYEDSISYCKKYGRLYDWNTAKKACMNGWHLPKRQEWDNLETSVADSMIAGKTLKSKNGWNNQYDGSNGNGTDIYGFSALPGGFRYSNGVFQFLYAGGYGLWWTAEEDYSGNAYGRGMYYTYDSLYENYGDKSHGRSVRCVADTP